jgi:hypothetical protein
MLLCRRCNREWWATDFRGQAPHFCEVCRPYAKRDRAREDSKKFRASHRESLNEQKRRAYAHDSRPFQSARMKTWYSITLDDFEAILLAQGNACAFCRRPPEDNTKRFHVDHDHACCPGRVSCGKCIRGLLCHFCNSSLVSGYEKLPLEMRTWPEMNAYLAGLIERDPYLNAIGGN